VNYSCKGIVHPKLIIIYSPANCSKPVCVYLNTKEYIWKNVSNQTVVAFIAFFFPIIEVNGYHPMSGYQHSSKYIFQCLAEERNSQ